MARSGREGVGPGAGERAAERDRLLGRGQRLLAPAEALRRLARLLSEAAKSGVKASGGPGQLAVELHRLLGGGQGLLAPPEIAQSDGESVDRAGKPFQRIGVGFSSRNFHNSDL